MIRGLNHLTLAVSDLDRSLVFYRDLLGLRVRALWPAGAYLEAGALWLCLSVDPEGRGTDCLKPDCQNVRTDYTHVAFDVAAGDFAELAQRVRAAAPEWKKNRSEGESLYIVDPDGHRLELHVGSLESRLADYRSRRLPGMVVYD